LICFSYSYQACEKALLPFDVKGGARGDNLLENGAIMNKIQILRDIAIRLSATHAGMLVICLVLL